MCIIRWRLPHNLFYKNSCISISVYHMKLSSTLFSLNYFTNPLHWISDRYRCLPIQRLLTVVLGQPLYKRLKIGQSWCPHFLEVILAPTTFVPQCLLRGIPRNLEKCRRNFVNSSDKFFKHSVVILWNLQKNMVAILDKSLKKYYVISRKM